MSEFTSSPRTSPRFQKPVAYSPSMSQLQVQDPLFRTPSEDQDKSSPSRVSYEGSSSIEYQVRYVGGYRSGPEDDSDEPIRLMPYYRSPTRHRKVDEPLEGTEGRRRINQLDSTLREHSVTSSQSSYQSRDEGADMSQSYNRSPSSSPYHHRKGIDPQNSINNAQSVGLSPVSVQKQKKTAIVSPLLDMSESRPRSVPPGVLMFDPTDPESERVEEVSKLYLPRCQLVLSLILATVSIPLIAMTREIVKHRLLLYITTKGVNQKCNHDVVACCVVYICC